VRKYVLSFCLLLAAATVMGQHKSVVNLIRSKSSTGIKLNGKDVVKVYEGTFKQDFSTLTSDSAYFYPAENAFDAFGHVDINQGDTLHIYSDKLNYNGNTKVAILTDNVRLVDKDATLTTNHLTYNTATRIGTYTDGGKLVNKDNTLLSKNGYYFAFSRDSYFRYNVSLTTPDALVKTDTMRYNTKSRISYFYGPTNIYSTKNEKDRDTLYTENGTYATVTEQAAFGKNNLYHSGTKSLKGDSLFYDKKIGYGRAVGHVVFDDKEQKTTIRGNLGTYFKKEERTIVTEDPYVIMVTETKDSTKTDSAAKADSIAKTAPANKKGTINMAQLIKKTIPGKTDSVSAPPNTMPLKDIPVEQKNAAPVKTDSLTALQKSILSKAITAKSDSTDIKTEIKNVVTRLKTDTTIKKPPVKSNKAAAKPVVKNKPTAATKTGAAAKPAVGNKLPQKITGAKDTSKMKTDSIYMSADSIETQIMTYKDLKIYYEKQRLAHLIDTGAKAKKVKVKDSKFLTGHQVGVSIDTSYRQRYFFGKPKPVVIKKKPLSKKQLELDSLNKKQLADSILKAKLAEPNDTTRIRIIIAHHHFKLFKSDLQSKADSMFYSNADSTIRCFVNPIMWTQGSQLSGDTIYLQMKHKKLDNMSMFPHAFIVNIEKDDSLHFNQLGGKRMRGWFKDDKLSRMLMEGNAESIYFARDSGKMTISGMQRSLSSKIRADFKDNKVTNMGFYTKPENRYGPLDKFKEDDKLLKGFIWKPKERPVSKESIIPSYHKKKVSAKKPPAKPGADKTPSKKSPGGKVVKDSTLKVVPGKLPGLKTAKDSLRKDSISGKQPVLKPLIKAAKDSTKKDSVGKAPVLKPLIKTAKDSTSKIPVIKPPAVKAAKDSTKVD